MRSDCQSAFDTFRLSNNSEDNASFKKARSDYQSIFHKKRINFYLSKLPLDFKSSKKFYSDSIQTKKSKSSSSSISSISINNTLIECKAEIDNHFNLHFTSLVQDNQYSIDECKKCIFENFKSKKTLLPTASIIGSFNFRTTSA